MHDAVITDHTVDIKNAKITAKGGTQYVKHRNSSPIIRTMQGYKF